MTSKPIIFLISIILVISICEAGKSRRSDKKSTSVPKKKEPKEPSSNETEIEDVPEEKWTFENKAPVNTRRILYGKKVGQGKRPYMVYLQLPRKLLKNTGYRGWLCGGVILHPLYVLTSAACVEDAEHFYVVGGTNKFVDGQNYKSDDCVAKNRRRVIWKCVPKNYKYDYKDDLKWSANDIAIIRVNEPFKFGVVEPGCKFATDRICYNNVSFDLETPGTKGCIAGWGSDGTFREGVYRADWDNEKLNCLQEARVCIMDKSKCVKKWSNKFTKIINEFMICTRDVMKKLSVECDKRYANCTEINRRRSSGGALNIDLGRHFRDPDDYSAARRSSSSDGGFCENDHGGPLIVKYKNEDRVIGVISACKIDNRTHSCHGPFLYTSLFRNRQFISCAINKDVEEKCTRVFRSGITHDEYDVDWSSIDDDEEKRPRAAEDGASSQKPGDDDPQAGESSPLPPSSSGEAEEKAPSKEASDQNNSAAKDRHSDSAESLSVEVRAKDKKHDKKRDKSHDDNPDFDELKTGSIKGHSKAKNKK